MKKNIIAKIGAAAVVLTMVTTSLVGGTFAKYTSTVDGKVTASVAKWAVSFTSDGKALPSKTEDEKVYLINANDSATTAKDKIAPGSYGQIDLSIDGTNAEVGFTYTITVDTNDLNSVPIKFYASDDDRKSNTPIAAKDSVNPNTLLLTSDAIMLNKNDKQQQKETVTIYWAWNSTGDDDEAINNSDTEIGVKDDADRLGTITLTMTAEQLITPEAALTE